MMIKYLENPSHFSGSLLRFPHIFCQTSHAVFDINQIWKVHSFWTFSALTNLLCFVEPQLRFALHFDLTQLAQHWNPRYGGAQEDFRHNLFSCGWMWLNSFMGQPLFVLGLTCGFNLFVFVPETSCLWKGSQYRHHYSKFKISFGERNRKLQKALWDCGPMAHCCCSCYGTYLCKCLRCFVLLWLCK